MEVDVDLNKKSISLGQSTYLKKILSRYDISNCKPAKIPINLEVANSFTPYENQTDKSTVPWYQSDVEAFIWPAILGCPDMAYLL